MLANVVNGILHGANLFRVLVGNLDTVELVMAFEEAFDIEIPDEDAEKIRTVQDAVDYIGKHAKAGK